MMWGEEEHDNVARTVATTTLRGPRGELATPKGRTKATTPTLHASVAKGSQRTMAETEGGGNTTRDDGGQQRTTTTDDERRQRRGGRWGG
jgi:hypothetical protein